MFLALFEPVAQAASALSSGRSGGTNNLLGWASGCDGGHLAANVKPRLSAIRALSLLDSVLDRLPIPGFVEPARIVAFGLWKESNVRQRNHQAGKGPTRTSSRLIGAIHLVHSRPQEGGQKDRQQISLGATKEGGSSNKGNKRNNRHRRPQVWPVCCVCLWEPRQNKRRRIRGRQQVTTTRVSAGSRGDLPC